jgi:molybdate transport system substrate-binding protein
MTQARGVVGALAALAALLLLGGCAGATAASPSAPVATAAPSSSGPTTPTGSPDAARAELTIFAAASLRDAFGALAEAYAAVEPGVDLAFSFDGSSVLRAQIEQGAPVDVFAAADEANVQRLVDGELAAVEPVAFAGTTLAIVVPATNPAGIATPADLARTGVRIVAAGADVPITRYATALVEILAGSRGAPAGFVAAVDANVVSREDNVRAVLAKIELGEGDAAIVYATDATIAGDAVRTIPIPPGANVVATFAAVVPTTTRSPDAAAAFLDWLAGPEAREVLARFGFVAPASQG